MNPELPAMVKERVSRRTPNTGLLVNRDTGEILLTLYRQHSKFVSARLLARYSGVSMGVIQKKLAKLVDLGLVQVEQHTSSPLYSLNTEHPLWGPLKVLLFIERK